MKKTLVLLIGAFMSLTMFAQQGNGNRQNNKGKGKMEHRGDMMQKHIDALNLTEKQQQEMKAVNESFRNEMKTLQNQDEMTVKAHREKRQAFAKEHREAIAKILTPEQREQMQAQRKEMRSENKGKGDFKGRKGKGRPAQPATK